MQLVFQAYYSNVFGIIIIFRMSCAFCYYGLVLMTTELFESATNNSSEETPLLQTSDTCAAECKQLQTTDYMDLLWTTLAEFPGMYFVQSMKKMKRNKIYCISYIYI